MVMDNHAGLFGDLLGELFFKATVKGSAHVAFDQTSEWGPLVGFFVFVVAMSFLYVLIIVWRKYAFRSNRPKFMGKKTKSKRHK